MPGGLPADSERAARVHRCLGDDGEVILHPDVHDDLENGREARLQLPVRVWHRLPVDEWGMDGAAALRTYTPTAAEAWDRVERATWAGDTGEVAAIAAAVAEPHGLLALPSPAGVTPGPALAPAVSPAFARQVATDVASLADHRAAALGGRSGRGRSRLTQVVWVADLGPRLAAALDALFSPSQRRSCPPRAPTPPTCGPRCEDFARAVARLHALDDVTSELDSPSGAPASTTAGSAGPAAARRRSPPAPTTPAFAAVDGDRSPTHRQPARRSGPRRAPWSGPPRRSRSELVAEVRRTLRRRASRRGRPRRRPQRPEQDRRSRSVPTPRT